MTGGSLKKDIQSDTVLFDFKSLVKLVLPLVAEQFLLMSVGMADTVMVTTAGESAVSGVSLVDNINLLLLQIFAALSTGGAVVVSQYIGRNKKEDAKKSGKAVALHCYGCFACDNASCTCIKTAYFDSRFWKHRGVCNAKCVVIFSCNCRCISVYGSL